MSQQRARLINSTALVAVIGAFGCQPAVPTAAIPGATAPGAPTFDLLAARAGKAPAKDASATAPTPDPCGPPPYTVVARNAAALFHMSGTRNVIEGNIWTNDGVKMVGNREVITGDAHFADNVSISGASNYIAGAKVKESSQAPWTPPELQALLAASPVYTFTGDVNLGNAPVWESQGVLKPGVYHATGKIVLSTNGVKGNVTLIGSSVQLPGKNHDLQAYAGGVLAYATDYGANALHVSGNNGTYQGAFIAPNGEFQMTGAQNTIKGSVWTDSFKISGANNRISNSGTTQCPTPAPTATPTPTVLPTDPPTPTPSPSPVVTPTAAPTPAPTPVPTAAPTVTPTPMPSVVTPPTPTPTPIPQPSPTGIKSEYTDNEPYDVDSDANGYIFTANYLGASISKLTPMGLPVTDIEQQTSLRGIAVAADNSLWVTCIDQNTVRHISAQGALLGTYPVGGTPIHVRIDGQGNIWTTDNATDTITKLSPTGARLGQFSTYASPKDLAFDGSGNVWVACNGGRVTKMKTDGTLTTHIAFNVATAAAESVTIDQAGNAWVTLLNLDKVAKISPTTTSIQYFNVGDMPHGIVTDHNGFVWVANTNSNNVMKLAANGAILLTMPTGGAPKGIAVDKDGRILTANFIERNVSIITP